jgi:hypothetical protein
MDADTELAGFFIEPRFGMLDLRKPGPTEFRQLFQIVGVPSIIEGHPGTGRSEPNVSAESDAACGIFRNLQIVVRHELHHRVGSSASNSMSGFITVSFIKVAKKSVVFIREDCTVQKALDDFVAVHGVGPLVFG